MKKNIRDFELNNKKVIIRCDFNVPLKDGKIIDDNRIVESLPTIKYAIENGAKVILLSHLGRIKEKEDLVKNDLAPVSIRLSELLGISVTFVPFTRGELVESTIAEMKPSDVVLLQNTRYEDLDGEKESKNDSELGRYWASLGDIYINDAFGTAHRSHASNVGIATNLPSGVGFLIEKELNELSKLDNPEHPFVVMLGGSKVKDKIGVIKNLIEKADHLVIGGGMAFTFLNAIDCPIGKSILDEENISFAKDIYTQYSKKILLPVDIVTGYGLSDNTLCRVVDIESILDDEMGLDIGPVTVNKIIDVLDSAKTIFWNGPLGAYEYDSYSKGTKDVLDYLSTSNKTVILGGGDIVAAATQFGYKDKVTHASTGGGATLEYMEGKVLPGIDIIQNK